MMRTVYDGLEKCGAFFVAFAFAAVAYFAVIIAVERVCVWLG